jgi:hypothetical protein
VVIVFWILGKWDRSKNDDGSIKSNNLIMGGVWGAHGWTTFGVLWKEGFGNFGLVGNIVLRCWKFFYREIRESAMF